MKKILSIFIINTLCLTAVMAQANVSNIRVELRDTLLNVTYNLKKDSKVELFYSSSNGAKYIGPLKELTGDCGEMVKAGEDRVAVWNPVEEIGYIEAPNSVIKVVAEAHPEPEPVVEPEPVKEKIEKTWDKHSVIMVGANLINGEIGDMPLTFMYGHYRHFGWYFRLESSLSWKHYSYQEDLTEVDDMRYNWLSGKVGFLWNINDKFVANFGVGVQTYQIYVGETTDLGVGYTSIEWPSDYMNSNTKNEFLSLSDMSATYFVGEIGITYNWKKLSVGLGVTPLINRFVGYEEEDVLSMNNYQSNATPIYKTKLITNISVGINF